MINSSFSFHLQISNLIICLKFDSEKWYTIFLNEYSSFIIKKPTANKFIVTIKMIVNPTATKVGHKNLYHFKITNIKKLECEYHFPNCNDNYNKYFFIRINYFWKTHLAGIFSLNNMLLLHSSSLEINNKVAIFLGKPGAGKSTICELHPNYQRLSDDTSLLKLEKDRWKYFTTFLHEKNPVNYGPKCYDILGLYILKKSLNNRITLIKNEARLLPFLKNVFFCTNDNKISKTSIERTLSLCYNLVKSQNIYLLEFRKEQNLLNCLI